MAAPTGAARNQLIKKAHAAGTKSAGMRMLLEAGLPVNEVAAEFGAPYGFTYGVATRAGLVTPTPRASKPKTSTAKASTAKAAKAPARATAKATTSKAPARARTATRTAAKSTKRSAAKA